MVDGQYNLRDTDGQSGNGQLQFDCLNYRTRREKFQEEPLSYFIMQTINYCVRPEHDHSNPSMASFQNSRDRSFRFAELRRLNVTVQQLLAWSASVDLAERYLLFIDQPVPDVSSANTSFYNCTEPWFGSQCQYSFDLDMTSSFDEIVETTFSEKFQDYLLPQDITTLTCYTHLTCNRGRPTMCLDWREVCNGRIDCLDSDADEAQCFELELNECAEGEFRCHNGLCIPGDFWRDEKFNPDCLDRSDEPLNNQYFDYCVTDPSFRCEEHSCRLGSGEFTCGDGQCVTDLGHCENGRHHWLQESLIGRGKLDDDCWSVMVCLTKLQHNIDVDACDDLFDSTFVIMSNLLTCDSLFQFPTVTVGFGHIRFFYHNNHSTFPDTGAFLPDYVCFDEKLCDSILPTFRYEDFTCLHREKIVSIHNGFYNSFVEKVNDYFRGCIHQHGIPYQQHASLYCCKNSSKCISKHRLVDGIEDCHMGDDEEYGMSCSFNDTYRFRCTEKENKCWSSLLIDRRCNPRLKQSQSRVFFQSVCDRFDDLLPLEIDGENHTDETECTQWPCDNIYTRCDGIKRCPNGEDEENCLKSDCPSRFYPCVSPSNYSLICLPQHQVNDKAIDCIGASDELQYCRTLYPTSGQFNYLRFLCKDQDYTQCEPPKNLCDQKVDCPLGEDEKICDNHQQIDSENSIDNQLTVKGFFKELFRMENQRLFYFSINTSETFPAVTSTAAPKIDQEPSKRSLTIHEDLSRPEDDMWAWLCNRGLYARVWLGDEDYSHQCFCPPSYYGDSCQYQNERVSLTIGLLAVDQHSLYTILVTLIDETNEINSYEQFGFMASWGCKMKFNMYLLYSTRPKNISKNYSVIIEAFDRNRLVHHASWYFPIQFLFLPVNRLVAQLVIPVERAKMSPFCNLTCHNGGQCTKYENTERFFCRCLPNWSGSACTVSTKCDDCSSDSICVGSFNNRSICLCSQGRMGPRCLLKFVCPANVCENNGQCVLVDESLSSGSYVCICPDEFHGPRCEQTKLKLKISFDNVEIPSHIAARIITVSNQSQPTSKAMIRKILSHQTIVEFRISDPFHMVFATINDEYYSVVIQQIPQRQIFTSVSPARRCAHIYDLLRNSDVPTRPLIRRVKHYHSVCHNHTHLRCFYDEVYMCLCTIEKHANCFEFDHDVTLGCRHKDYCKHGASCYQDHPTCPSATICICADCYFGTQCQFYARGFGLTFDDILRYEIRRDVPLPQQRLSVKLSLILTMFMFGFGLLNGILSCLTFRRKQSQKVGSGLYLLASSITSILTTIMLTVKVWFFVLSQMGLITDRTLLHWSCISIEPLLKLFLYTDNWLNGCVGIERSISVSKGVTFNKITSKRVAKHFIFILPVLVAATILHEPIHRDLFDDEEEQRTYCVTRYSPPFQDYNSAILLFHFLAPFIVNVCSSFIIIINVARQRTAIQIHQSYGQHLGQQFTEHMHILISPICLIILSVPRLIISLTSSCLKSSHDPWLYLSGFFISFVPSILLFVVFVLPSKLYIEQFRQSIKRTRM